jgi:hypothetical protein
LFDFIKNESKELTHVTSPRTHHFNPFILTISSWVRYYRCGGEENERKSKNLLLENLQSPMAELSLFKIDNSFPSFSPVGDRITYMDFLGILQSFVVVPVEAMN